MLYNGRHGDHIHIAAGENGHHIFPLKIQVLQSGDREQAGVLHHHFVLLHHIQEGLHQLRVGDGDDVVHIFLYIGEDQIAGSFHRYAVGDGVGGGESDHVTRLQTGLHGGGALGLHANDGDIGVEQLGQGGHAGGQPAPADGDQDHVHIGQVLEDLIGDGALAGSHLQVIEGGNVGEPLLLGQLGGLFRRLVEDLPVKDDVGAVILGVVDLDQGSCGGHDDGGGDAGGLGGIGQSLGVVAGRGGNEPPALLVVREGTDLIIGPADLVGPCDLHVFRFQIDLVSTALRQGRGMDQVGGADHALQHAAGSFELV